MVAGQPAQARTSARWLTGESRWKLSGKVHPLWYSWVASMRWLMIGLLVSLGALLLAAAGMARHIRLHRTKLHHASSAHETDLEH